MDSKEIQEIIEKGGEIRIDINLDGHYITTAIIKKRDKEDQEEQEDNE